MADEREKAMRISNVAVDLTFEMISRVNTAVAAACGERGDIVRYIVGTAFVAAGAMVMKKYGSAASHTTLSPEDDALDIVRGAQKKVD